MKGLFAGNFDADQRAKIASEANELHQWLESLKKQGTNVFEPLIKAVAVMANKSSTPAEFGAASAWLGGYAFAMRYFWPNPFPQDDTSVLRCLWDCFETFDDCVQDMGSYWVLDYIACTLGCSLRAAGSGIIA